MDDMDWKYVSEDGGVTLHDCVITKLRHENGTLLIFEDGFDVFSDDPQNDTGRHKRTGKAAVFLKNGQFLRGRLCISENEEKPLREDELAALGLEVLDCKRYPDSVFLACDAWHTADGCCYCEIEFTCTAVLYCWNEFTDDAWFQD